MSLGIALACEVSGECLSLLILDLSFTVANDKSDLCGHATDFKDLVHGF